MKMISKHQDLITSRNSYYCFFVYESSCVRYSTKPIWYKSNVDFISESSIIIDAILIVFDNINAWSRRKLVRKSSGNASLRSLKSRKNNLYANSPCREDFHRLKLTSFDKLQVSVA